MIRDVLILQQREIEQRLEEPYVAREHDPKKFSHNLIKVILGPRRAGKSFFATHLINSLGKFGYINFDDERLFGFGQLDELISAMNSRYGNPKLLLLDEVQNLPNWELFVNRLQRQGYNLLITGSNAHLLSTELSTHLTGRHIPIVIFPFSFAEYLKSLNEDLTESETAEALRHYAEAGGYPEPIVKKIDIRDYLTTLLKSILYKDIVIRHRIRSAQGLEELSTYLMTNIACEYSYQTLAQVTRCKSVHTIDKYLYFLEEAFLFFSIRRFSYKLREQMRANRKVYCIDNGLVTSSSFQLSSNLGRLYENIVAIALHRMEKIGRLNFYYWKSVQHEEVDFVVKKGTRVTTLIQVCANVENPKTYDREIRALLKASSELNCKDLFVITDATEREEKASWYGLEGKIQFIPLWKWLTEVIP